MESALFNNKVKYILPAYSWQKKRRRRPPELRRRWLHGSPLHPRPFGFSTLRLGQVAAASPAHCFRHSHHKELKMSKTDQDAREHLLKMRAMVRQLEFHGLKDHSMYGYLIVMFVRYEGICWQMLNEFYFFSFFSNT